MFHAHELKQRRPRRTTAKLLQARVCLDYALFLSGLPNLLAFAERYLNESSPRDVYRWTGKQTMHRNTAKELEKRPELKGILELFDLPLFKFLDDRELNERTIRSLLAPYQYHDDPKQLDLAWRFPNDAELLDERRLIGTIVESDSATLVARGDIYGFTAIVGLARLAQATQDGRWHRFHVHNMYRALPAVARLPWFKNHVSLLRECVDKIYHGCFETVLAAEVDWAVIQRQIDAPVHEPCRELRPRDPKTNRFTEIEDPFKYRIDDRNETPRY